MGRSGRGMICTLSPYLPRATEDSHEHVRVGCLRARVHSGTPRIGSRSAAGVMLQ